MIRPSNTVLEDEPRAGDTHSGPGLASRYRDLAAGQVRSLESSEPVPSSGSAVGSGSTR